MAAQHGGADDPMRVWPCLHGLPDASKIGDHPPTPSGSCSGSSMQGSRLSLIFGRQEAGGRGAANRLSRERCLWSP